MVVAVGEIVALCLMRVGARTYVHVHLQADAPMIVIASSTMTLQVYELFGNKNG